MHPKDIQLKLGLLVGRIQLGHRAEGRGAGVGAQDRDVAACQLIGQLAALGRVDEVHRPHVDGHAIGAR